MKQIKQNKDINNDLVWKKVFTKIRLERIELDQELESMVKLLSEIDLLLLRSN